MSETLCIYYYSKGSDYKYGDIRLVEGSYNWEGRVEIYLNGEWGTISYGSADSLDAFVVCRQLGYDTRCKLDVALCENSLPIHVKIIS